MMMEKARRKNSLLQQQHRCTFVYDRYAQVDIVGLLEDLDYEKFIPLSSCSSIGSLYCCKFGWMDDYYDPLFLRVMRRTKNKRRCSARSPKPLSMNLSIELHSLIRQRSNLGNPLCSTMMNNMPLHPRSYPFHTQVRKLICWLLEKLLDKYICNMLANQRVQMQRWLWGGIWRQLPQMQQFYQCILLYFSYLLLQEDSGKGMMGAEPLEVTNPHQSSTTEHQHQQTSLIAPSTLEDGCWDSGSSNSKHSLSQQHHFQLNGGGQGGSQSQGSSTSSSSGVGANKGARRTRHR